MAEKEYQVLENVPGKYYVDDQCIACGTCITEAPNLFQMNESLGYAFVKKQPESVDEINLSESVLELCPVGSIKKGT